ncbi:MAG: co-chaperone DjlA [Legionella sp.]|nr:MAG: co-chaperone DjlA [Legionella sp.]PJD98410.1 MAG: co-chaperone DjlA [Legionella sp.]
MTFKEFFNSNPWWGRIIGAFLGYLALGPVGALIGIMVGNMFDIGLANHFSNPLFLYHTEAKETIQRIFFEATFATMGHIAKADGYVSTQEIQMAKQLMNELRLNKQQKELAKHLFNEGKQPTFRLDLVLNELRKACSNRRELLKLFVDIQYKIAQADGLSLGKIRALDAVFAHLGFAPLYQQYRFYEDFSSQEERQANQENSYHKANYQKASANTTTLEQAYVLLDVSPSTSKHDVKRAYRKLLSKNHPDKLIAQGLPESMIKLANEKTHKIMKAYELICKSKGW